MPSFLVSTIAQTAKIIWSGDEINLNLIPEATFNLRASPVNVWNKRVFFFFLALLSCVRHAYESFCRFLSFPHTETKVPVGSPASISFLYRFFKTQAEPLGCT